jgi:hypothetical protein
MSADIEKIERDLELARKVAGDMPPGDYVEGYWAALERAVQIVKENTPDSPMRLDASKINAGAITLNAPEADLGGRAEEIAEQIKRINGAAAR